MADIRKIFYPESIAVVGATENLFKWGSYIFTNIIAGGFQGKVYPVAKKKETVYGHRAYGSVAEIQDPVDLVFITTPAASVMGVLADCVAKGVKNVVMITSGFSETGEEGKRLEEEMVSFARANGINVVGPNTMGIVNTAVGLYATGSQVRAPRGGISIIAQSGNVGNQIMEWAEQQNIGVGKFVGSGNEGVIGCEDYIGYFGDDADTTVVLMYIEGVDDGRRFMDSARGASMRKPVIALKAGRTEIGSRAAASHTGAMAGSFKTYESALRQSGVILVKAPTELLTISSAFDSMPLPKGNRVGVVTLGGGVGGHHRGRVRGTGPHPAAAAGGRVRETGRDASAVLEQGEPRRPGRPAEHGALSGIDEQHGVERRLRRGHPARDGRCREVRAAYPRVGGPNGVLFIR